MIIKCVFGTYADRGERGRVLDERLVLQHLDQLVVVEGRVVVMMDPEIRRYGNFMNILLR